MLKALNAEGIGASPVWVWGLDLIRTASEPREWAAAYSVP
jgi:hypothetical protein